MDGYEAVSSRGELVVSVGGDGVPLGVRLSPAVMDLPAEELATRIECGHLTWPHFDRRSSRMLAPLGW